MSVGQKIYDMVENMMLTALIDSPRFDDYKIYSVETDPGLIKMIDDELGQGQGFGKKPPTLRSPAQVAAQFRAFMNNAGAAPAAGAAAGVAGGGLSGMLVQHLGVVRARQAMQMLANPQKAIGRIVLSKGLLQGANAGAARAGIAGMSAGTMMKGAGVIGLILLVINSRQFIEAITKMMTKKGGIFDKTFRNKTNTLQNILRNREQQQSIRSGFTQVIFTTNAGTTDPRDSYNTYEQTIHDEVRLTNLRNIRSVGNVVP